MERLKAFLTSKVGIAMLVVFGILLVWIVARGGLFSKATTTAKTTTSSDQQQSGNTSSTSTTDTSTPAPPPAPPPVASPPPALPPAPAPAPPPSAPPPPAPKPPQVNKPHPPTPPPHPVPQWSRKGTIGPSDTLSTFAARHGTTAAQIYAHNRSTILTLARQHHFPNGPNPMDNVFAGEQLYIP